ncbi:MAG TPA: 2-C-methyl-D-erythritol 4-phosphate cytidylyltransferase [Vicinamibacterales bacterium]|nr:2-C-methyl-D-erythritol 4-phosphate cytidylyltransferase [Vicinamibacterales bacterium]
MHVTAIIAAGGRGLRFGGASPKQFLSVAGTPVLERSLRLFLAHPEVDEVVVVLPLEAVASPPPYLVGARKPVRVVAGGARRQDSVSNGFDVTNPETDVVIIHDAARPFASADLVSRTIAAAAESGAAIAALPARDTVKRASPEMLVRETMPRDTIFLAQTPQAFRRRVLADALALAETGTDATDEAALAERAGHPVRIVAGEAANMKITTPDDVAVAEAIAAGDERGFSRTASPETIRMGTGYDLHRLVEGRPLMVGGVQIPSERGAMGHSDGDVACHAVTDALLGAACLGDIGRHFPDTDPAWKGAAGVDLLGRSVALLARRGYTVVNVDITVILERPKIKDHVATMRASIAAAIGIADDAVSVKGKTNEGVDAVGRGEAIAAHAVAVIRSRSTATASTP